MHRDLRALAVAGLAMALGGCALIASYDFGKYAQDPHDGGAGGTGGVGGTSSSASTSSTGTSSAGSSGTGTSSAGSSGTGTSSASSSGTGTSSASSSGTGMSSASSSSSSGMCSGTIAGQGFKDFEAQTAGVVSVAVDAQTVYWTTGALSSEASVVARADKATPTAVSTFGLPADTLARSLTLDATNAYWITTQAAPDTGDTVWKIPKVFGTSGTALHVSATGSFGGIAVGNGNVYFTSTTEAPSLPTPGIFSISIVGGTVQKVVPLSGMIPGQIVLDGLVLYFVVGVTANQTEILSYDLGSLNLTVLAPGQPLIYGLVADATNLYWSTGTDLRKMPKIGGAVQTFGSANIGPCGGMSLDPAFLYCTNPSSQQVLQFLLSDTTTLYSASALGAARGVAADCSWVYFGLATDLVRLPRM